MHKIRIATAWLPFLIIVLLLAGGCSSQEEDDFGIYLLAEDIHANLIASFDFDSVELQDDPLISIDDIITYSKNTHEIKLTVEASDRISSLRPPTTGTPFIVCVGSERIYSGALWPGYSSGIFEGATMIDPIFAGMSRFIQISLGHIYSGEDPRSNSRIFESLEHAGKLTIFQ